MRDAFVTVVEPKPLLREGLVRILRSARFPIVNSAVSLDETIMETLAQHESLLLVIGSGVDPDSATKQIELFKKGQRTGRVAVLADHYDASDVISAFRAGASAYLVKVTPIALIKSLELVMLGETIMSGDILRSILDRRHAAPQETIVNEAALAEVALDHAPHLSVQEKRILGFLVEGYSNKVIAHRIGIAEATVKTHIKAILRKVRVQNRTQAAVWAMNKGERAAIIVNEHRNGTPDFPPKGTPMLRLAGAVALAPAQLVGITQPGRARGRSSAVLEAPALVAGLDDEQRGRHLGVAEDTGPFAEPVTPRLGLRDRVGCNRVAKRVAKREVTAKRPRLSARRRLASRAR
jgi:two-component system nitrate/nitrite response regulator NarL